MKANELMVGDWVVYRGDTEYTNPVRIDGMDIRTCSLITEDREDVGFDGIEPIPITPKILKKNGFGYIENDGIELTHFYLGNRNSCRLGLHIGTNNKGDYWVNTNYNDIYGLKYVHELQHALRLFKLEKEIEL